VISRFFFHVLNFHDFFFHFLEQNLKRLQRKDKIEDDAQKVEEPKKEEETASGSSWWGSYTSMLNKAVDSVSTAVDSVNTVAASAVDSANTYAASAVVSAKQKVKFVKLQHS